MGSDKPSPGVDKALARADPAAVFETPEQVRDHGGFTVDEKIEILKRWAYDGAEAAVACEEGMPGDARDDFQQRIFVALEALGGDAALDPAGPTKQHGLVGARRPGPDPAK